MVYVSKNSNEISVAFSGFCQTRFLRRKFHSSFYTKVSRGSVTSAISSRQHVGCHWFRTAQNLGAKSSPGVGWLLAPESGVVSSAPFPGSAQEIRGCSLMITTAYTLLDYFLKIFDIDHPARIRFCGSTEIYSIEKPIKMDPRWSKKTSRRADSGHLRT